jgi:predicted SnoaL-like aldol condensation-catalyzing enzyme
METDMRKFEIKEEDVIDIDNYIKERSNIKKEISLLKQNRRIPVGPHATFYFECYQTMIYQIQEMLFIERGGKEQLLDEIKAYNPLVPKGKELVATLMFEIDNEKKRKDFLNSVGGIENKTFIQIGEHKVMAKPEADTERTSEDGKASSVHFLHFELNDDLVKLFIKDDIKIMLGFDHPNYKHFSEVSEVSKKELSNDFDISH